MNSKGHLFISLGKSAIRVFGGIIALLKKSVVPLAVGIIVGEVGGGARRIGWWEIGGLNGN